VETGARLSHDDALRIFLFAGDHHAAWLCCCRRSDLGSIYLDLQRPYVAYGIGLQLLEGGRMEKILVEVDDEAARIHGKEVSPELRANLDALISLCIIEAVKSPTVLRETMDQLRQRAHERGQEPSPRETGRK
jgi:hypothetical protein